ncbi:membrane protein, putative [hydrothermal vent metagenome]|uniref:Membrane protein, putative n=1 Tax=hydrothermal vent metagenome TaxID=652676 RepID=A0A3B1E315_9ZZZZ
MTLTWLDLGYAVVVGGGVGLISGLFGVGGGFLIVPLLNILLKVPMELAVGAGSCQVLGPATTSILARRINKKQLQLPLTIAGGLFAGVLLGASTLELAKTSGKVTLFQKDILLTELIVLSTYFVLLLSVGLFAVKESMKAADSNVERRGLFSHWLIPPYANLPEFENVPVSIVVIAWFGLGTGFVSGLLGMSGGLVLLPGLIYLLGIKTERAIVASILMVWMVSFQGTIVHAWHGNINLWLVAALLLGGTLGARIGTEMSVQIGGRKLRQGFGGLLLATSLIIAARLIKLLWL